MTPLSNKPSSSSETIPSYDNYLLNLQSHVFPYRSPRPLTLPSQLPTPAYLSCWWTGDSTDFWGHYLETTLLQFSEPLSSRCLRGSDKPTTALMTQWREQFKRRKTIDPLLPLPNPTLLAQLGLPHPLTRSPPLTPQSTHCPNWLVEQTPFPLAEQTPFPLRSVTGGTLLQLREVGLKLTEEELRQWALDVLLSPEDWKWLWESPVPVPIQSMSPIPPLPHLPWYDASSAGPLTTFTPNVPNTSAPFVDWPHLDTLNEPVPCAPVPYVENSVMWAPVVQPQPLHVRPPPEWLTDRMLESESRDYSGGNVTIEDVPTAFSPFSAADCTLLNHFSFEDFVAIAFPDLARDLNIQI